MLFDAIQNANIRARFAYDAIFKRQRIIEEYVLGQEDDFYDVLFLYNQNVQYVYSFKTKKCVKLPINMPWVDFGIDANSTSLGESYIGSAAVANANVHITMWQNQFVDFNENIDYFSIWTFEACLPVTIHYKAEKARLDQRYNYYDLVPGRISKIIFYLKFIFHFYGFCILNLISKAFRIRMHSFHEESVYINSKLVLG